MRSGLMVRQDTRFTDEADGSRRASTRLAGPALALARAVWLAFVVPSVALFVLGLPAYYERLQQPCVNALTCNLAMALTVEGLRAYAALGVSAGYYAAFSVVCWTANMAIWSGMGLLIFWKRSDDWLALLASLALILFSTSYPGLSVTALATDHPVLSPFVTLLGGLAAGSITFFLLLFPDGRLVARWTALVVPLIVVQVISTIAPPASPLNSARWPGWLDALLSLAIYGTIIVAQVSRYRDLATTIERQQIKWVAFAIVSVAAGFLVLGALFNVVFPQVSQADSPASLFQLAYPLIMLLLPLSVGFAMLRKRLWDVDLIIRRTLVYSLLTTFVVGVYVLVVGYLGAVFQASANLLISLIATSLIAVLFQPLRGLLQRGVSRLLYGQRDEPYVVLAGLGQRLKTTLSPDDVLPAIVTTLREALKVPYAAIQAGDDPAPASSPVAEAGTLPALQQGQQPAHEWVRLVRLPLTYQRTTVGELLIAPRGRDEVLTPADLRLLDDLTQPIGAAVHTVRLTSDLQRSRERLVTTREEERRRLRRDLHDGLGPLLSAVMLKVGLVREFYQRDPTAAGTLLDQLETELDAVIRDIRRLVYNLRPPALDELGLVGALREYVARLSVERPTDQPALVATVEAPDPLPPLPAAVEVAAYRIAQEAVTNVLRHAHARSCRVALQLSDLTDALQLEVSDDGVGIDAAGTAGKARRTGVGLASMRERAEELDGMLTISQAVPSGTCISVRLPLTGEQQPGGHSGAQPRIEPRTDSDAEAEAEADRGA